VNHFKRLFVLGLFSAGCSASDVDYFPTDAGVGDAGVVGDAGSQDADAEADETSAMGNFALGTSYQALSLPSGYGMNNESRCGNTWSGNCYVPEDKKLRLKFHASTCTNWEMGRFVEAVDVFMGWMNARGWTVQGPDSQDRRDYDLKCDNTPYDVTSSQPIGAFIFPSSGGGTSCTTVAGRGKLCKFTKGTIWIYTAIAVNKLYSYAGDTAKKEAYRNFILHELGHSAGLGHYGTDRVDLMAVSGSGDDGVGSDTYSTTEFNFLSSYIP
jgi:hypothetical protein